MLKNTFPDVTAAGRAAGPAQVRVAVGPTVPLSGALAAVAALSRCMPDVAVDVRRTSEPERRVTTGSADAALLRAPLHDRSLSWAVAFREPRVALVPASHRLACAPRAKVADLWGAEILEPWDDALGVGRPVATVEELLTHVACGRGFAVVPRELAARVPSALAAVPLPTALPSTVVVAYRAAFAGAATSAYVDAVVEFAAASYP
jgi:DNA-binding transcriptional LysR family regulator